MSESVLQNININEKKENCIISFFKKNIVLSIAFILAVITSLIVLPDKEYLEYFDFKTLTCLLCTLGVVCALKNIHFFTILARKIVVTFKNTRFAILGLLYITFIGSMLIANDMALLTFLPLGYFVLSSTKKEKYIPFTFIMQNISANLGGMLTPFGNPQNLYLYELFNIGNFEFVKIMFLPFIISIILITLSTLFIKKEELVIEEEVKEELPIKKTIIYLVLFVLTILVVFRIIPFLIGLLVVIPVIFLMDKEALKKVDYALLLTFVCFFIFSGNISRIDVVKNIMSGLLEKNTLLVSVISCQVISNVPTSILLGQFTSNYKQLLVGVNIGGVGTLISSLASLITFKEFSSHYKDKVKLYLIMFTLINFLFLIILTSVMFVLFYVL